MAKVLNKENCFFGAKLYEKGKGTPQQTREMMQNRIYESATKLSDEWYELITASDVGVYELGTLSSYVKYGDNLAAPRSKSIFQGKRILLQRIIQKNPTRLIGLYTNDTQICNTDVLTIVGKNILEGYSVEYIASILFSAFIGYSLINTNQNLRRAVFPKINTNNLFDIPFPRIDFTTTQVEREQRVQQITAAYKLDNADEDAVLAGVKAAIAEDKTDIVHDVLAHLAQVMIDLNKEKQDETQRFLGWLEDTLKIIPKDDKTGIPVFSGYTIIQNYLGDYQKGESELPFEGGKDSLYYRLHQNRNKYHAKLADIKGKIQTEYEKSLDTLRPIKAHLSRTDALIDKIVYRLYGLTDAEIELIERPQYEQALMDAKAQVVGDDKIKDDEERIERIAENMLPAAKHFFERIEAHEAGLDADLPHWRDLPPDAPTFLQTGDYNLRTLPEHMDFSTSAISYTKAVEVLLHERIFEPFRQRYTSTDVTNDVLKKFMDKPNRNLTLGNYGYIIPSSSEPALRAFMTGIVNDVNVVIAAFKDGEKMQLRNKAAHDEVLSRDEAQDIRAWAMEILNNF